MMSFTSTLLTSTTTFSKSVAPVTSAHSSESTAIIGDFPRNNTTAENRNQQTTTTAAVVVPQQQRVTNRRVHRIVNAQTTVIVLIQNTIAHKHRTSRARVRQTTVTTRFRISSIRRYTRAFRS